MTTTCVHCARLRDLLDATNVELGRPLDSFDHDRYALPRAAFPTLAEVEGCECRCHSHLRMGHRA